MNQFRYTNPYTATSTHRSNTATSSSRLSMVSATVLASPKGLLSRSFMARDDDDDNAVSSSLQLDELLEQACHTWTVEQHTFVRHVQSWSLSQILPYLEGLMTTTTAAASDRSPQLVVSTLSTVLGSWTDEQVYAACVSKELSVNPLSWLETLVRDESQAVRSPAACAWAQIGTVLDRMNRVVQGGHVWWMNEEMLPLLAEWALTILSRSESAIVDSELRAEELEIAAISILTQLLRNGATDWMVNNNNIHKLVDRLQTNVTRLNDPNMPFSAYTRVSLHSLLLLLTLQQHVEISCRTSETLQHCVRAAFVTHSPSGPRWTHSHHQRAVRVLCWSILEEWIAVDVASARQTISVLMSSVSLSLWASVVDHSIKKSADRWNTVRFLLLHCRHLAREGLHGAFLNHGGAGPLLHSLLESIRVHDSLEASAVLRVLVEDRRSALTHDALSRSVWEAMDERWLNKLLETTLQMSSSSNTEHARQLCLLDVLYWIVVLDSSHCETILSTLSSHSVELLVQLMQPTERGRSRNTSISMIVDSEGTTPPVNNLSRLDETNVSVVEDEATIDDRRGNESSIRIAAATILAVLGNWKPLKILGSVLQTRMLQHVHQFVGHHHLTCGISTMTLSVGVARRLRLWQALSTSEHEDFLTNLFHSSEVFHRKELVHLQQQSSRQEKLIQTFRQNEQSMMQEIDQCNQRLAAQTLSFQRQKVLYESKTTLDAKQLADSHVAERSLAERRAEDLAQRLRESQGRLEEATREVERLRRLEAEASSAVKALQSKNVELVAREKESSERALRAGDKLDTMNVELQSATLRLEDLSRKEKQMQLEIARHQNLLAESEESQENVRDSLESLFADMVSLAQLYEINELNIASKSRKHDSAFSALQKELEAERARCKILAEKNKEMECENEMMSRRYARTREKLEKERADREREVKADRRKRAASNSYIQQLHRSTTSSKVNQSIRSRGSGEGKENDSYDTSIASSIRASSPRARIHR